MKAAVRKRQQRARRQRRVRGRLWGTAGRPRLSVFRSLRQIYAQLIDDTTGRTLCQANSLSRDASAETPGAAGKRGVAREIGKTLAAKARLQGIHEVVFDRRGYRYHGRVRALAEGAREAGLKF